MLRGPLPFAFAAFLAACGAFAVDDTNAGSGGYEPPRDAAASARPGAQFDAGSGESSGREAGAPDTGAGDAAADAPEGRHCDLAYDTTYDFTHDFEPITVGWYRSDALRTDFAGLIAVSNAAPSLAHCISRVPGPALAEGVRLVYHVQITAFPGVFDPVRILTFGDDVARVRLTVGSGRNARVAQLGAGDWGTDFGNVPTDAVYVASFRKTGEGTTFCAAVRGPGDDLTGVCNAAALRATNAFLLPDSLQELELGLPANAQGAATVSVGLRIEPLPP